MKYTRSNLFLLFFNARGLESIILQEAVYYDLVRLQ